MDRIDTFQDLLDLLDRKPEWADELRARLLTPELLALPEQLARFAETANKRFDALESDVKEMRADVSDLTGHTVPLAVRQMVGKIAEVTNSRRPRWMEKSKLSTSPTMPTPLRCPLTSYRVFGPLTSRCERLTKSPASRAASLSSARTRWTLTTWNGPSATRST